MMRSRLQSSRDVIRGEGSDRLSSSAAFAGLLWHRLLVSALGMTLLMLPRPGLAQSSTPGVSLHFERLSLEEGLSQTTVLSVTQDRRGFLWLGTQDGLNRYDGYGFETYRHDPLDTTSLSESFVQVVYEDDAETLWAGTWGGGLNRFDRATGRFRRYEHDPSDPGSLSDDIVLAIFEDSRGMLWIGTAGGLDRYDKQTDRFAHFRHDSEDPSTISDNFVWSIAEDASGSLWIGTYSGGLNRFDPRGDGVFFRRYQYDGSDPTSISDDANVTVFVDAGGTVWAGTATGLDRYDPASEAFEHFRHDANDPTTLCDPLVQTLHEDRDGGLWVGTANGLCRFDPERRRFTGFHHNPSDPKSLSHNVVRSVYEDRSGILWIGTGGGGLSKYNRATELFGHYKHDPSRSSSLSNSFVWDFAEDRQGFVWIGTDGGGLSRFNPADGSFETMRHDPADPQSLSDDVVLALATSGGFLWAGTYNGGLNRVDVQTGKARRYEYTDDAGGLSSPSVNALLPDSEGDLWIGTWGGGLNHYDALTERFRHFQHDPGDPHTLSNDLVTCLLEDEQGDLWVGTNSGGLNRYDASTGGFTRFVHDDAAVGSLSHDTVYDLFEDELGTLWVATAGGLNRFDRTTQQFDVFTTRDGLPHGIIYGILQDREERLWLSTNAGLARFEPGTGRVESYRVSDGLQSNEFNAGAAFRSSTDELYFGGINGFNRFSPEDIRRSSHVPPVVLTGFKRYDREVGFGMDLADLTAVDLSHDDNFITFEFAALDFVDPRHNRYAYMLEGVDTDWRYTDGRSRSASYTKLEPGHYTFRLRGANSDGTWNYEGLAMVVNVIPPWWGTWWFRLASVLSLAGAVVAGGVHWHRSNLRRVESRREEAIEVHRRLAEARESERMHLARELHDGAVQDLYGARIQLDALAPKLEGEDRRRIDGVHDTLHHVYATLRDVSREWRPPILGSFGLAKAIRSHVAQTSEERPEIAIIHDLADDGTVLPERVRLALYRIYQEAMRNALRHADASQIRVSMALSDDRVTLQVRDDGCGFTVPSRLLDLVRDNHLGLVGAAERAESVGGVLHVDSRIGDGTTVEVRVPIYPPRPDIDAPEVGA